MDSFLHDLRHSARMLFKNPGLTITCVITLSLGIGLTTLMFCIINGSLYEPLPFEDSRKLLFIVRNNLSEGAERMGVSIHDFVDWRDQQTTFEDLAGYYSGTVNLNNEGERPIRYQGSFITPSAFILIRVQPLIGRIFTEEEMSSDTPPVIILGYNAWQNRFGGDPEIIGKTIRANGETMTIIGVMPEGFVFPDNDDVWLPQRQDPLQIPRNQGVWLNVMGRIKEGVTLEQAGAEFDAIATRLAEEYPDTNEGVGVQVSPVSRLILDSEARIVMFLMLIATFTVLLIACFNVANLLLARAAMRTKEMAVRTSLGASRGKLIWQLMLEAIAFSAIGALLGLLLGYIGITIFDRMVVSTDPPWWFRFNIDMNVVLFVAGLTLISGIVSGILPSLQASRSDITDVLKDESRGASSFRMSRFSRILVITEIAFSCGLLVTAGLITKSVINVGSFDFGVASEKVFTARVGLFESDYPTVESRTLFWRELHTRLNEIPGVESASLTPNLPLRGSDGGSFIFEGVEYPPDSDLPTTGLKLVSPDYFDTFEIELYQGRDFSETDIPGALTPAIVNQSFVDRYSPGESPLGKRARGANEPEDAPWYTIVGVVADEWLDVENENPEIAYGCLFQADARFISIAVRTRGEPMSIATAVRDEVMRIDHDLPIYWVMPMTQVISDQTWVYGVFGSVMIIAGLIALFLASVGLYGVMAFSVSRRTQEIGVRMALGARSMTLIRMILQQGAFQLGVGLIVGLGLAMLLARGMRLILFGVTPSDPLIYALILITLLVTGFLACYIPARRATRVNPVNALRHE